MPKKNKLDIKTYAELFSKTKLSKPASLFIYGLLSDQELSGYDIYKLIELKAEALSSVFGFNKATIYNTLKKMEEIGHTKVVKVVTETNRPPKTIYKLTDEGLSELRRILLNDLEVPPIYYVPFLLDLGFAKALSKEEIKEVISTKIEQLEFGLDLYEKFKDLNPGAFLKIIGKAKRDMSEALLKNLKEMLKLVDKMEHEELFKQFKINGDKLKEIIESGGEK
jgi:DNA-binding PadR family transcriptional regulator